MSAMGKASQAKRLASMTPAQISDFNRRAANIKWAKIRAAKQSGTPNAG